MRFELIWEMPCSLVSLRINNDIIVAINGSISLQCKLTGFQ